MEEKEFTVYVEEIVTTAYTVKAEPNASRDTLLDKAIDVAKVNRKNDPNIVEQNFVENSEFWSIWDENGKQLFTECE